MMVIAEICDLTIKVAAVITEWMTISLLGDDDDGDDDGDDDDDDDDDIVFDLIQIFSAGMTW